MFFVQLVEVVLVKFYITKIMIFLLLYPGLLSYEIIITPAVSMQ